MSENDHIESGTEGSAQSTSGSSSHPPDMEYKISAAIENTFLLTVNKTPQKNKSFVYMEDVASNDSNYFTLELLEQALFERLLLPNPSDYLIPNNISMIQNRLVIEEKVITYLFGVFELNEINRKTANGNETLVNTYNRMEELILRNVSTTLKQPEIYGDQNISTQLYDILQSTIENIDDLSVHEKFFTLAVQEVFKDEDNQQEIITSLRTIFNPIFVRIHSDIKLCTLITLQKYILPALLIFVSDKHNHHLANLLLDYSTPHIKAEGVKYSDTLFGQLLCLSIMPKNNNGPYEYYENPQNANMTAYNTLNQSLWNYMKIHLDSIYLLIKSFLLMGGETREKMLNWIGNCLQANTPRGHIWNTHSLTVNNLSTSPDSFMIGLAGVLLRLAKPLMKPQMKVLNVDPTYCSVTDADKELKGVHMKQIDKETCLLPTEENDEKLSANKYNFITEIFFMTHKTIDLGMRVCIEKLMRMNRELHRLQNAYQDTVAGGGSDLANNIMQMLSSQTQQFLCLQNLILEPSNDQLLFEFYGCTATWLSQLASRTPDRLGNPTNGYAPQTIIPINLPLRTAVPNYLRCIPEFIIENIIGYLQFFRHFDSQSISVEFDVEKSIFTMILVFMGDSERVRNPHLRARLAEGLESLLPKSSQNFQYNNELFTNHPDRLQIVPCLLKVFVSIEMTGQSVQFEQKFNYRRPMYAIMDHIWKIDEQRECFKILEIQAESEMEAVDPPLFLRFVNLLINDAIYLLDESLNNLQQIRVLQEAQNNGEWERLPANERQQNLSNLQHLGMLAKFDNILGRDTIKLLKMLTSETTGIFCHASMVDRVASMLNYFLLHLVGPKKGNFKVKDKKEYEFDPANTVLEICRIYVNLQDCDEFCLAVSQDGRSYSPKLFEYAEEVLIRICGGMLIGEMNEFSLKVKKIEEQQREDDEALTDVPDEFLDPIMSTLMTDPVILPSSKISVDRSTIARHLLSDQSDPFNRSPLTMDQLINDVDLKKKITDWMTERREQYRTGKMAKKE